MLWVAFFISLINIFYGAVALRLGWGWFITPVFGVEVPALSQVIGLTLIVHYLIPTRYKKMDDKDTLYNVLLGFFKITFFLLFAWITSWTTP